jgi:hypothetical protein
MKCKHGIEKKTCTTCSPPEKEVPNLGNGLVEPEDLVRVSVKVLYRYLTTNEVSPTKAKVSVQWVGSRLLSV